MAQRPECLTFDGVINQRLFGIPNYQRAYSWGTKQREDLFLDIKKLGNNLNQDRHHFMSTIVCLQKEKVGTDQLERLEVVDGQQRLTTLCILLRAISKNLSNGGIDEKEEANKIDRILVKDEQHLVLSQTNYDSSLVLKKYLLYGTIPEKSQLMTIAENNLFKAFSECETFVNEWEKTRSVIELLKIVRNRLDFIFYALEDESSVYTVFEVLNSRGLEVNWLDKCKSMLMGIAFECYSKNISEEKVNELQRFWSKVYSIMGKKVNY